MYTTSDLTSKEITYQYRTYGNNGFFSETHQGLILTTIDGKYRTSYPDSDGYSWWLEDRGDDIAEMIGKWDDYVYGDEMGKIDAVNVLNRLIGGK